MQQIERSAGLEEMKRRQAEAVLEPLTAPASRVESLAEVAHDARNMVTALGLYCDLLQEPGVLTAPFAHYGSELRMVATASRRLVENLVAINLGWDPAMALIHDILRDRRRLPAPATGWQSRNWEPMPAEPIESLSGELLANRNLLAALAGPSIALTVKVEGGALPVRLTSEDLTRVLVNLVKNASEAMPGGGQISVGLHEFHAGAELPPWLMLRFEDNGPGIPRWALDKIFGSGYTTHSARLIPNEGWPSAHRGLGLSITRSIVEAAGGRIHAANRNGIGARFEIELPVSNR
jgi:signal transduction histidine kinase